MEKMNNPFIELIKKLPPAHVNSSREIVRHLVKKYERSKSSYWAYKLSRLLGYEPDMKEIHGRYTEYPKTDGPKDYSEFKTKLKDNVPF